MSVAIYYFSGTGNSLYVAKRVAEKMKGDLIPIASMVAQKEINIESDIVGIIFPIYYANLPNIIRRFSIKLKNIESKYVFVVCTYGGGKGDAIKSLNAIMGAKNISAVYGIHMPQNAFFKASENHRKLYKEANVMVELICKNTEQKKEGMFFSNILVDIIQRPLYPFLKPMVMKYLMKISNTSFKKPIEELIPLADKSFKTNEKCNSCGICVKVCPVNNIVLVDKKPTWLHKCENCLACYNYCPQRAIETSVAKKDYYYKHPEISVTEIIQQKKDI